MLSAQPIIVSHNVFLNKWINQIIQSFSLLIKIISMTENMECEDKNNLFIKFIMFYI